MPLRQIYFVLFITLFCLLSLPSPSQAQETIQEQIEQATAGSTIYIEAGTYHESLIIKKPLTLIGRGEVIIHNQQNKPAITIESTENVHIHNLQLINPHPQEKLTGIQIKNSNQINLRELTIDQFYKGIDLLTVKESQLEELYIRGREGHFSTKSNGITLTYTHKINIANNEIENVQDGVYIDNDYQSLITQNQIHHSRYGVHLMYSSETQVVNNTLHDNVTGIMHMLTARTLLAENVIQHQNEYNGFGIVLYDGREIEVLHNQLLHNQVGISLQKVDSSSVSNNFIIGNQTGIQFLKYDASNQFTNNEIYGNILSVAADQEGAQLTGNYWDDYEGFDLNGDGLGDTPYLANDSYSKLMIRKKPYQFFFQSPAVVALNKIEKKLPLKAQGLVQDVQPLIQRSKEPIQLEFKFLFLIIGGVCLAGGLITWRKIYI